MRQRRSYQKSRDRQFLQGYQKSRDCNFFLPIYKKIIIFFVINQGFSQKILQDCTKKFKNIAVLPFLTSRIVLNKIQNPIKKVAIKQFSNRINSVAQIENFGISAVFQPIFITKMPKNQPKMVLFNIKKGDINFVALTLFLSKKSR